MKPLNEMSAQQKRLYDVMSDISEECYCAGWMAGNEYAIWDALGRNEPVRYGMGEIDKRKLTECASLSLATDSWIIWRDDEDGLDQHDSSEWGAYAISINEWKKRVAERAVSPAESVQSIDTPEFWATVSASFDAARQNSIKQIDADNSLISHIDAQLAKAREEGERSGFNEGSKMVEEIISERDAARRELSKANAALAARQAPDLSKLVRWDIDVNDLGIERHNVALDGRFVYFSDVQALLVQPLQQEGGKDLISVLREYMLREMPSGTVINDPTWWAPRIARAIAAAAPQPSDNLQQASTAQVEPAKVREPTETEMAAMLSNISKLGILNGLRKVYAWMEELPVPTKGIIPQMKRLRGIMIEIEGSPAFPNDGKEPNWSAYAEAETQEAASTDAAQLPCPFCGSSNISAGEVSTDYAGGHGAQCTQSRCDDCGALGPEADLINGEVDYGDVKAIAAWNRRATESLLRTFLDIIHDNGYAIGDRLQSLSTRIQGILGGDALDKYPPRPQRQVEREIVEQEFDAEEARAILTGTATPAQATPEGWQDLPPLPGIPGGYSRKSDYDPYGGKPLYTADQMRDYARAALAASQQETELPELPEAEYTVEVAVNSFKGRHESVAAYSEDQMREYALAASQRAPDAFKEAYMKYSDETDWVQEEVDKGIIGAWALGMHRTDVLKKLVEGLRKMETASNIALQSLWELLEVKNQTEAMSTLRQWKESVSSNCAVAAIQFALSISDDSELDFLRLWNEGEFDKLRKEWPEAPEEIYIGADPLYKSSKN